MYLLRTDGGGSLLWERAYGAEDLERAYSVQETADRGFILAGSQYGDIYLVKTDWRGDIMWDQTLGADNWDEGRSVQETKDGGFIVAGLTLPLLDSQADMYLLKTNGAGVLEWDRAFGGEERDAAYCVQETSDGGFIVAGETMSAYGRQMDMYLVKTDGAGNPDWDSVFGGDQNDAAFCVQETADGGFILAGETYSSGAGGADVYLAKTDARGNLEWDNVFGGGNSDSANCVRQTPEGGFILAGNTYSFGAGNSDVYLVKVATGGGLEWERTFGGNSPDLARWVETTADGGYILAGQTDVGQNAVYLIKTDANGNAPTEPPSSE